jgi:Mrp family chromosome partitioning ATPase
MHEDDPSQHMVGLVLNGKDDRVPDCKMCEKGFGDTSGERFQREARLVCSICQVNLRGAKCWYKLHGCSE